MHPRRLRCSSLKYSRYCTPPCTTRTVGAPPVGRRAVRYRGPQRGSRAGVVVGAPRASRCDARLSPRAASGRIMTLLSRRHRYVRFAKFDGVDWDIRLHIAELEIVAAVQPCECPAERKLDSADIAVVGVVHLRRHAADR